MQLPIWGWGVGVRPVWESSLSTHLADGGQPRRKNPYVTQKARASPQNHTLTHDYKSRRSPPRRHTQTSDSEVVTTQDVQAYGEIIATYKQ